MKIQSSNKRSVKILVLIVFLILITRFLIFNSSVYFRKKIYLPFSLHLNKQDIVLKKGEERRLFVYGANKWVKYSSTNFKVASVDLQGRVVAHKTGKVFIKAKVDNQTLICRIRVIDLNKSRVRLKVGRGTALRVRGGVFRAKWQSSNKKVAIVNRFGYVKSKSKGRATIMVKVKGKKLRSTIIVE